VILAIERRAKGQEMPPRYVLVIDDDEGIRELAVAALHEGGMASVSADDTEAGLAASRQTPPAVILLDPMEAPLSDAEFIRAYRQLPGPHAPVLLFSARTDAEQHAAAIGADGAITKPFELEDFLARIGRYLSQS
jgi:DNA-binding response OmpR family regulator